MGPVPHAGGGVGVGGRGQGRPTAALHLAHSTAQVWRLLDDDGSGVCTFVEFALILFPHLEAEEFTHLEPLKELQGRPTQPTIDPSREVTDVAAGTSGQGPTHAPSHAHSHDPHPSRCAWVAKKHASTHSKLSQAMCTEAARTELRRLEDNEERKQLTDAPERVRGGAAGVGAEVGARLEALEGVVQAQQGLLERLVLTLEQQNSRHRPVSQPIPSRRSPHHPDGTQCRRKRTQTSGLEGGIGPTGCCSGGEASPVGGSASPRVLGSKSSPVSTTVRM